MKGNKMTWTKGNTKGEWEVSEYWQGGITESKYFVGKPNIAHVNGYANAKLISLAPRMADAILEWLELLSYTGHIPVKLMDIAMELRQLKAGNKEAGE